MDPISERRAALVIASLGSFVAPFMGSSIHVALPAIGSAFQADAVVLSWVASSYILAGGVSLVPFGRLADIVGRKKIFTWGYVAFTLASLACGLCFSAPALIVFRVLQGVSSAMVFSTSIAILTSVFPPSERGKILGVNVAAVYTGLSLGPFLGGLLTQHFTWRSVFFVNVPLGAIVVVLVVRRLKGEWAEARGEGFDVKGAALYCLSLVAVMYGISALPALRSLGLLLCGCAGLAVFVKWQSVTDSPLLDLGLFRSNRVFTFSSLAALIHYSATFAVTFLLSLYLQHIKGLAPQSAGLVLVTQPLVMAILSPVAGRISDKIEPGTVASLGMALTTVGLFVFTFIGHRTTLGFIVGDLVLLGFGFALFSSPNTNAIMSSVEKRFFGLASGSVGTMRMLGMMMSMGIVTVIFSVSMGRVQITPEYYPALVKSAKTAFAVFAFLCLGGVFASLVRGKLRG